MLPTGVAAGGPPSPEVTESIGRVPSRAFSHRPECSRTSRPVSDPYDMRSGTLSCARGVPWPEGRGAPGGSRLRWPVPRARSSPDSPSDERLRAVSLGIGSPTTEFSCRGTLRLAAAPNCTVLVVTHTCIVASDRRSPSHDGGRALRTSPLLRGPRGAPRRRIRWGTSISSIVGARAVDP